MNARLPPWPEGEAVDIPPPSSDRAATNWRSTPQREFLRCLTAALHHEKRLRGKALAQAFRDLVPDHARHLGGEVTDASISGKGRNCWVENELDPDSDHYHLARWVVSRGKRVDLDEVLKHLGTKLPDEQASTGEAGAEVKEAEADLVEA